MADRIKVDPDELKRISANLNEIHGQLKNTGRSLLNANGSDYPGQDVPSALSDFGDKWDYALGKIADEAGSVGEGLGKAGEVFREFDTKVGDAFTPKQQ